MLGIPRQLVPAFALTILTTTQAMLVEAAKASNGGKIPYDTSAAVLLTELLKLCIALGTWLWQRPTLEYTGLERFSACSLGALIYAVPASFFIIQNNLVFKALALLDPPTFQLFACFKIIPVGVLARIILGQRRTNVQWASLVLLALGMATTTITPHHGAAATAAVWLGIGIVTFNGFLSALSSVINEWLIKHQDPLAPLMFKNLQIYVWGSLFAAAYSAYKAPSLGEWLALLLQAATGSPFGALIILNNAAVGLCVSAVRTASPRVCVRSMPTVTPPSLHPHITPPRLRHPCRSTEATPLR